ncbi:MAG: SulP family inorganic anion transporter, partial [Devosiaceae bacterium]
AMRRPIILSTIQDYTLSAFYRDVFAGFSVAMVAIPLSLAIAIASGAPPETGLVTAVVAGFLISALGGSRVQIGGPTGAFIVVVFGVIAQHGYDGLVLATMMAGAMLVLAGFLRAGRLIAYVPEAVINGFTIGIAIIIATSQLKDFFGLNLEDLPAPFIEKSAVLWQARETINASAVLAGLATIVIIVGLRRLFPRFPGLIIAIFAVSAAGIVLALPFETVADRFGALSPTLSAPALPDLSWSRLVELFPSALVIAFLAGVESLLSALVADRMIDDQHRPNAELTAQGFANIGSALFSGLPATGAIARTATNIRAGGCTPVAGMVHAVIVLLVMLFAAPYAGMMAMPALAGLLMLTAWNMSEPHKWPQYWRARRSDQALLVITLLLTVFIDLTVAIGAGVAVGLALRLHRQAGVPTDWTPPKR